MICVSDNGDDLDDEPAIGLATSIVKERLHIPYGPDVTLELADSLPHGLTVTIRIALSQVTNL